VNRRYKTVAARYLRFFKIFKPPSSLLLKSFFSLLGMSSISPIFGGGGTSRRALFALASCASRFYRASTALERRIPGTGLGLVITRTIIERHHGTISLLDQPGPGTTFQIRLPSKQPPSRT
jgi:hypothetical protein